MGGRTAAKRTPRAAHQAGDPGDLPGLLIRQAALPATLSALHSLIRSCWCRREMLNRLTDCTDNGARGLGIGEKIGALKSLKGPAF